MTTTRRFPDAAEVVRDALRRADAESSRTIRECDMDAKVRSARRLRRAAAVPAAIAQAPWPPPKLTVVVAVAAALLGIAALVATGDGGRDGADMSATSATEWRDGE